MTYSLLCCHTRCSHFSLYICHYKFIYLFIYLFSELITSLVMFRLISHREFCYSRLVITPLPSFFTSLFKLTWPFDSELHCQFSYAGQKSDTRAMSTCLIVSFPCARIYESALRFRAFVTFCLQGQLYD